MPPGLAAHGSEGGPPRVVGDQTVLATTGPAEHVGAQAADEFDGGLVALPRREVRGRHVAEPGPPPDVLVQLQDEGAGVLAIGVAVHLHDPRRGVQDVELERVEDQVRAEPDVPAASALQIRAKDRREPAPRGRVHPVGGDHQVVARGQRGHVRGLGTEVHPHPERSAASLQDGQQPLAAHRGETVPARGERGTAEVHVDVVPAGELAPHGGEDLLVGVLDAAEGLVGEHHPEAERVVGGVALPDGDVVPGVQLLGEGCEVQAAGPAAEDSDAHGAIVCRKLYDRQ